ncbi:exopolysaccharide biosynthesis protein [Rhizobium sp. KVB221]|uniref:Exopolysaccharide biosynthesis protein n=1 Tax=Rhizobium setariae TaxID=2801340 RepID=A0A936YQH3_9HYPH|nr:exopolysaccharide biosynthesis protein [Rhizobium setariae]MBL0373818.1 exopolysaccharide biosynthesis protein [Rhizobium setariae]
MLAAVRSKRKSIPTTIITLAFVVFVSLWPGTSAFAETTPLPPHTKIRLTIVLWMPTKGAYDKWDALGGDFEVSDRGILSLPVAGELTVGNLDATRLSIEIAGRLKAKIGLVEMPEVTVAIVEYPPVYVVGDVATPGEYKFHVGLTVLQSLAMSGGRLRSESGKSQEKLAVVGTLRGLENSILRSEVKIARLLAEMSGATEIPAGSWVGRDDKLAAAVYGQEKEIFVARANLLKRQVKSYTELRDLLSTEITNLDKKAAGSDADIASVEGEMRNMKSMVEKGIALPSRLAELERLQRGYYAGRLDLSTAAMRARQGLAEASRNIEGLYDRRRTDVATELQAEQASLDQLKLKRDITQRQLLDTLAQSPDVEGSDDADALVFTVDRLANGSVQQLPASENTLLQPGDVVRVVRRSSQQVPETSAAATVLPDKADPQTEQTGQ